MDDLANYKGEWVEPASSNYRGYDVSRAAAAVAGLGGQRDAERSRGVRAEMGARRRRSRASGRATRNTGTSWSRPRSSPTRDLYALQRRSEFRRRCRSSRLLSKSHAASLCDKVDPAKASPHGPLSSTDHRPWATRSCSPPADSEGNMVSWVNSNFCRLRLGHHRAGLRHSCCTTAVRCSRSIPKSPNVDRAAQAAVQHSVGGLRDAKDKQPLMTITLMGGDMQAQGHAQALVEHARPRRELAGGNRHGALPP